MLSLLYALDFVCLPHDALTSSGGGVSLLLAFLSSTAPWWLYFGQVAGAVLERIRGATAEERGRIGPDISTYLHLPSSRGSSTISRSSTGRSKLSRTCSSAARGPVGSGACLTIPLHAP